MGATEESPRIFKETVRHLGEAEEHRSRGDSGALHRNPPPSAALHRLLSFAIHISQTSGKHEGGALAFVSCEI